MTRCGSPRSTRNNVKQGLRSGFSSLTRQFDFSSQAVRRGVGTQTKITIRVVGTFMEEKEELIKNLIPGKENIGHEE